MSQAHLVHAEKKKRVAGKMVGFCQKGTEANVKKSPMPRVRTTWATK